MHSFITIIYTFLYSKVTVTNNWREFSLCSRSYFNFPTTTGGDAKEEVEKRTKEKKEEELVPKLQLETFKRTHKPAILSKKGD